MSELIPETVFTETETLLTVAPAGRLDTVTSTRLKEEIAAHPIQGRDLELDFSNVEYISSAGLRLLVALQKQVKADGHSVTIRSINAVVREVFRVSGFNKSFTVL